jgi:hypothetical protein
MPVLHCKRLRLFSSGDERAFFDFTRNIKSIRGIKGVGEEIQLDVALRMSDASLRDLVDIARRRLANAMRRGLRIRLRRARSGNDRPMTR